MKKLIYLFTILLYILPNVVAAAPYDPFVVNQTEDTFDRICDEHCSLRDALYAVCASDLHERRNKIDLQPGTYTLTKQGNDDYSGDLDIPSSCKNNVTIRGNHMDDTIIDINNIDRGFDINDRGHVTFKDVTIKNAKTSKMGGAIHAGRSTVTLKNVRLENNRAKKDGGAIYSPEKSVKIYDSILVDNTSKGRGGAIFANGATIEDSEIVQNSAKNGGGGMYIKYDLKIFRTTISYNESDFNGAGIYLKNNRDPRISWSTIQLTTIAYNAIDGEGYGAGLFTTRGNMGIYNTTLSHNSGAKKGGAIFSNADVELKNATFYKNSANSGGALYNKHITDINFSTFYKNSASTIRNTDSGQIRIKGTILGDQTSSNMHICDTDSDSTIESWGYNIERYNSCLLEHSTDIVNTAPELSSDGLQRNGGIVKTIALQTSSPVLLGVAYDDCITIEGDYQYAQHIDPEIPNHAFHRSWYDLSPDARNVQRTDRCSSGAYQYIPTVSNIVGLPYGKTQIKLDQTTQTHQIYNSSKAKKLLIKQFDNAPNLATVIKPNGESISLVNLVTAKKIDTNLLSSSDSYKHTYLSTRYLFDKDIAVFVGRDRSSVKVQIYGLKNQNTEITRLSSIKIHDKKVVPENTKIHIGKKIIKLKNASGKTLYTYKISDEFDLQTIE